jgi:hypothetical protein
MCCANLQLQKKRIVGLNMNIYLNLFHLNVLILLHRNFILPFISWCEEHCVFDGRISYMYRITVAATKIKSVVNIIINSYLF